MTMSTLVAILTFYFVSSWSVAINIGIGRSHSHRNNRQNLSVHSLMEGSSAAALLTDMFQRVAPELRDDSEVKKMIEQGVQEALTEKMKFFPGMNSIKSLLEWSPSVAGPRLGPVKSRLPLADGPRILSVHDMVGGYNELSDNDYLMLFSSWEMVDIFVYFSHVKVAVPPLQWTMVAHQHKRPALGTFMLEDSSGHNVVSQIIQNREETLNKLVDIADHYGFDGWFFNMESHEKWPKGDPERFVRDLSRKLKTRIGVSAMVIAYPYGPGDAMFEEADGVFVNYNWGTSPEAIKKVVKAADDRSSDVYMGMDSWGQTRRNNEPDPYHVKLCAENRLSVGVFAPGYTIEHRIKKNMSHDPQDAIDFDRRYWASIGENFGRRNGIDESGLQSGSVWPIPWKGEGDAPSMQQNTITQLPKPIGLAHNKVSVQVEDNGALAKGDA